LILVTFAVLAGSAHAQKTEIFKCRDGQGRWMYTDDKRRAEKEKCELVSAHINVAPPPSAAKPATRAPSSFPRESSIERASARGRQRDILEKELAAEQQDLAKAKQALVEQEAVRSGDERNYAKVLERLQPFKDRIETHEKNVEALRRELANLSR
jgi:hypothetical protein